MGVVTMRENRPSIKFWLRWMDSMETLESSQLLQQIVLMFLIKLSFDLEDSIVRSLLIFLISREEPVSWVYTRVENLWNLMLILKLSLDVRLATQEHNFLTTTRFKRSLLSHARMVQVVSPFSHHRNLDLRLDSTVNSILRVSWLLLLVAVLQKK